MWKKIGYMRQTRYMGCYENSGKWPRVSGDTTPDDINLVNITGPPSPDSYSRWWDGNLGLGLSTERRTYWQLVLYTYPFGTITLPIRIKFEILSILSTTL